MFWRHRAIQIHARPYGLRIVEYALTLGINLVWVVAVIGTPLDEPTVRTSSDLPDIQQRLVTSDNPPTGGGHLAPGGSTILLSGMPAPLNPDGVVSLVDNTAGVFCTGGLIGDRYVLTAAHCVEASSIYTLDYVSFDTAIGLSSGMVTDIFIHPFYDGSVESGYDIAVVELAVDAPADAPRYGLYTATNELGQLSVKAGYGRTGHGSTGSTTLDAQRRVGLNTYDATSNDFNNAFAMAMATGAYILYDFDSGLAENNAWDHYGVVSDLGFGIDEANAVSGDSGGPTFIHDGSDWRIAGLTAWGAGLPSDPPDVTPGITDGSWGELSADTRVSSYADFVQAVLDGTFVQPSTYFYSHGNVHPELSWVRPDAAAATLSDVGPVPYQTYAFTVDNSAEYDIVSTQNFDGVVHLYQGIPDPENPLVGLIAGNDDGPDGPGTSRLENVTLNQGATYTLMTSAKSPGDTGTFLNAITGAGQASSVPGAGGFTGAFAPEYWRFVSDHTEARVQLDAAPQSITLFGGDDFNEGDTDLTITVTSDNAEYTFDWTYFSIDEPGFDIFGVLINGSFTRITSGDVLFGSYNLTLNAGDEFGFRIHTVDGAKGAGIATIYNFRLTGDLDGDGFVGIADLNVILANWNQSVPPADPAADPSGDGYVGIDDLNTVLGNWNTGTPPASGTSDNPAIPEPTTGSTLGISLVLSLRRRYSA